MGSSMRLRNTIFASFLSITVLVSTGTAPPALAGAPKGIRSKDVRKVVSPDGKKCLVFGRTKEDREECLYQDMPSSNTTLVKSALGGLDAIWSPNSRYALFSVHSTSDNQFCEVYKVAGRNLVRVTGITPDCYKGLCVKEYDHRMARGVAWSRDSRRVYIHAGTHRCEPGKTVARYGFFLADAMTGKGIRRLTLQEIRRKNPRYYREQYKGPSYWWRGAYQW